jgi:hypothetical protein
MNVRKLYADLVTSAGDVYVFYVVEISILGGRWPLGGVERYAASGDEILSGDRISWRQAERVLAGERDIEVPLKGGPVRIERTKVGPGWNKGSEILPGISWRVVTVDQDLQATCSGQERPSIVGRGYSDLVELTVAPRAIGLERLTWGRVHLSELTVAYTHAQSRAGAYSGAIVCRAGRPPEHVPFNYGPTEAGRMLEVDGRRIELTPRRVLHRGAALGPDRLPNPLHRLFARWAVGRSDETRWLSDATTANGDDRGIAVHEEVFFF